MRYSVVVPVYKNAATIPTVVERLDALGRRLDGPMEGVFVVDGSPDDSADQLRTSLAASTLHARVLLLSRNFGSFSAIRAGLSRAEGEFIAVMAADLQEPVDVVERFFEAMSTDQCEVAIGTREGRDDPVSSSLGARVYWWMYRRFVNAEFPVGGVDVFGCTREVARSLSKFSERNTSLVGLLYWLGYRRCEVPYVRSKRTEGKSGWTFRRRLRYLLDSVYAFTDLPILLLQVIGGIGLIASLIFGLIVIAAYFAGQIDQPGYTPIIITILGSTSAILVGLGVVGSYVWRAFENGQGRPVAIVAKVEEFHRMRAVEQDPADEVVHA